MMIVMKMKYHISLTTKISTQTEKKMEVDFVTIKIRSPTNGYCLNQNNGRKRKSIGNNERGWSASQRR